MTEEVVYAEREFVRQSEGERIKATAKFYLLGNNPEPHFCVTAVYWEGPPYRESNASWGCLDEEIARLVPELAPAIKWHLAGPSGPMYYFENGLYLFGFGNQYGRPVLWESFAKTVLWGEVETDADNEAEIRKIWQDHNSAPNKMVEDCVYKPRVREILAERLPRLQEKFRHDMTALLGVEWDGPVTGE